MEKEAMMQKLKSRVAVCQNCHLSKTRKSTVFGEGLIRSPLVFVGEGPGRCKDEDGRPFVRRAPAGGLLTKMIESLGIKRQHVYICNAWNVKGKNELQKSK
jgi:DNA polymerase